MPLGGNDFADKTRGSYGADVLDHLSTNGTGFLRGDITVVALFEVHADFVGGFHLESLESFFGVGLVACHCVFLLFRTVRLAANRSENEAQPDSHSIIYIIERRFCPRSVTIVLRNKLIMNGNSWRILPKLLYSKQKKKGKLIVP